MTIRHYNTETIDTTCRQKISSLQGIRALAFIGVFSSHVPVTDLGAWGVSIFIVLSGFLMVYNHENFTCQTNLKVNLCFAIKKIQKLYALHIVTMLYYVFFMVKSLIIDFSLKHMASYGTKIILNVLLLQSWIPSMRIYFSLNSVAWFLSVCLFLYMAFPVLLLVLRKISDIKIASICIIGIWIIQVMIGYLSSRSVTSSVYVENFPHWVTYIFPLFRMGDFFIGMLLGYIKKKSDYSSPPKKGHLATILEALPFIMIGVCHYFSHRKDIFTGQIWFRGNMLYTVSNVMLIYLYALNRGLLSRVLSSKLLVWIGNISGYAFLIHLVILNIWELAIQDLKVGGVHSITVV